MWIKNDAFIYCDLITCVLLVECVMVLQSSIDYTVHLMTIYKIEQIQRIQACTKIRIQ